MTGRLAVGDVAERVAQDAQSSHLAPDLAGPRPQFVSRQYAAGYAAMASGFLLLTGSAPLFVLSGTALIVAGYAAVSPTFVGLALALALCAAAAWPAAS